MTFYSEVKSGCGRNHVTTDTLHENLREFLFASREWLFKYLLERKVFGTQIGEKYGTHTECPIHILGESHIRVDNSTKEATN